MTCLKAQLKDNIKLGHLKNHDLFAKFHMDYVYNHKHTSILCLAYNKFAKNLAKYANQKGRTLELYGMFFNPWVSDKRGKKHHIRYFDVQM